MKLKAWLDSNMASVVSVQVSIASKRKIKSACCNNLFLRSANTMVVRVFETMVQAACCHMEQTKCANQTNNSINSP